MIVKLLILFRQRILVLFANVCVFVCVAYAGVLLENKGQFEFSPVPMAFDRVMPLEIGGRRRNRLCKQR